MSSSLPFAGDPGYSDPDTLGTIPPVVAATYCPHCGESRHRGVHVQCRRQPPSEPPTYCTTCRRRLAVERAGESWTADCVKHGQVGASS